MSKQSADVGCGFRCWKGDYRQAVVVMTQLRKEEIEIAREECRAIGLMQVAQNLLLIIPLRSSDLEADLPIMNPPLLKQRSLISGDVVIKNDQAATFSSASTSLIRPC